MSEFVVTIRLPKNPSHDPQNKVTGECLSSQYCTDVTGEHHSFVIEAATLAEVEERLSSYHITRIEEM
jgi:hypothetical protein